MHYAIQPSPHTTATNKFADSKTKWVKTARPDQPASLLQLQLQHIELPDTNAGVLITNGQLPNGRRIKILIDGAAYPSFIKRELVASLPSTEHNLQISLAGKGITLSGSAYQNIDFSVIQNEQQQHLQHDFIAADINYDIILGKDWLNLNNPATDYPTNTLTFNNGRKWLCNATRPIVEILSATQFKRCLTKDDQIYYIAINELSEQNLVQPKPIYQVTTKDADANDKAAYESLHPQVKKLVDEFHEVFQPLGDELPPRREYDHRIDREDETAKPPFQPIYHLSDEENQALREELAYHFARLRPSKSAYGAPVFYVKQKNKLRLVIDYRALNKQTIKNRTALPNVPEMLDKLRQANFFTKIDLASGFHQVRMAEGHEHKTAFRTKYGSYEWLVMPLGLCNAPATFQSMVNSIFYDMLDDCVTAFIDDFCIFSDTLENHLSHLRRVLSRMKDNSLRARLHKCDFLRRSLDNYIGFSINQGKISVLPERLSAIKDFEPPTTWTELRGFIGLANTLHRFVKNQAALLTPLTDLLRHAKNSKDNATFSFSSVDLANFNSIKATLAHPSTLSMFDPSKPVHLYTDWSARAIGSYVCQPDSTSLEHPISFSSRKCNIHEAKYHPYEGEILALAEALRTHRQYLTGSNVKVFTDHSSLRHILDQPKLKPVQLRWLAEIQAADFQIEWTPGKWNTIADVLSRRRHSSDVSTQTDLVFDDYTLSDISAVTINDDLLADIRDTNSTDPEYLEITEHLIDAENPADDNDNEPPPVPKHLATRIKRYLLRDSMLYYRAENRLRIYVPKPIRRRILSLAHDDGPAIHNNWERTAERITRNYHWPNLHKDVKAYIRRCDSCQRNKIARRLPYGLLNPHSVPIARFDTISIDFIGPLPLTTSGFDQITVIVDSATKYLHCYPSYTTDTAKDTASRFETIFWRQHGLPRRIISDRDKLFTSDFWKNLMQSLRITQNMSTAYHPQTDGQTEIRNPWIEAVLRNFINHHQNNWDEFLHIIEHGINDSVNSTTGYTPFMLATGRNPTSLLDLSLTPYDQLSIRDLQSQYESAKDMIRNAQDKYAAHANKKRQSSPFRINDYVLIHSKDFTPPNQSNRPSAKLSPVYHGPFKIVAQHGISFQLEFPPEYRMHNVFHPEKLRPYYWDSTLRDPLSPLPLSTRTISTVLSRRTLNSQDQVLVQWKDHHPVHNIWLELTPSLRAQLQHARLAIPAPTISRSALSRGVLRN